MLSKYRVGDEITILIRGYDGDDWHDKGIVAEVREGNPPCKIQCNLEPDPYCYRLAGSERFYRESSVIAVKRHPAPEEAYILPLGCAASNIPLPA